jgi:hypothetical protein
VSSSLASGHSGEPAGMTMGSGSVATGSGLLGQVTSGCGSAAMRSTASTNARRYRYATTSATYCSPSGPGCQFLNTTPKESLRSSFSVSPSRVVECMPSPTWLHTLPLYTPDAVSPRMSETPLAPYLA